MKEKLLCTTDRNTSFFGSGMTLYTLVVDGFYLVYMNWNEKRVEEEGLQIQPCSK